ncbi:hypothetical protein HBI25_094750 [Parastagonospora nodorum]|nr:hypothetical protein HBH46_157870 [Parastagonospora nodorum]KAH4170809.1 hypothetical protein HBH43_103480 [Parastagonospora nodorum]KAH4968722.1 hypothetical protein HBI78_057490 [Parastagonospora nodorum]KAH5273551.1 hypothetical protein HBI70_106870 [Parastagonospora nodorum]KAH5399308.1 hypothetical protein HBI32_182980 [Parastagonospora nodorum]
MWTKSDILQLLQLLTMVILAMIHAGWCLLVHQVNMRRYANWHEPVPVPVQRNMVVSMERMEEAMKDLDASA